MDVVTTHTQGKNHRSARMSMAYNQTLGGGFFVIEISPLQCP
jgi:hypothetical protein